MGTGKNVAMSDAELAALYGHVLRTRPHPPGATPGQHSRYVAYCVCGDWTSGLLAVGVPYNVGVIEDFGRHCDAANHHAQGQDAPAVTVPAADAAAEWHELDLAVAERDFEGRHPVQAFPHPPGTERSVATRFVMRCGCALWSSEIIDRDDPNASVWLDAHQAHYYEAQLIFLATRRAGLPDEPEPTEDWAIDMRRRARAAREQIRREDSEAGPATS